MFATTFLLAAAESGANSIGNIIGESTFVTLGGIVLILWIANLAKQLWDGFKPQPPPDEKYASAETCGLARIRYAADLVKAESNCLGKIGDLATALKELQEDRKRNVREVWEAIRANEKTLQAIISDLNRALGRLEGRADVFDALKTLLKQDGQPVER